MCPNILKHSGKYLGGNYVVFPFSDCLIFLVAEEPMELDRKMLELLITERVKPGLQD